MCTHRRGAWHGRVVTGTAKEIRDALHGLGISKTRSLPRSLLEHAIGTAHCDILATMKSFESNP